MSMRYRPKLLALLWALALALPAQALASAAPTSAAAHRAKLEKLLAEKETAAREKAAASRFRAAQAKPFALNKVGKDGLALAASLAAFHGATGDASRGAALVTRDGATLELRKDQLQIRDARGAVRQATVGDMAQLGLDAVSLTTAIRSTLRTGLGYKSNARPNDAKLLADSKEQIKDAKGAVKKLLENDDVRLLLEHRRKVALIRNPKAPPIEMSFGGDVAFTLSSTGALSTHLGGKPWATTMTDLASQGYDKPAGFAKLVGRGLAHAAGIKGDSPAAVSAARKQLADEVREMVYLGMLIDKPLGNSNIEFLVKMKRPVLAKNKDGDALVVNKYEVWDDRTGKRVTKHELEIEGRWGRSQKAELKDLVAFGVGTKAQLNAAVDKAILAIPLK